MSTSGPGALYIVTGGRSYWELAVRSITSLLDQRFPHPIWILTTDYESPARPRVTGAHIERCRIPAWAQANPSRYLKTDLAARSPFERTLFLDADTEIVGDVRPLLEDEETRLAMALDVHPNVEQALNDAHQNKLITAAEWGETDYLCQGHSRYYNSGVIAFDQREVSHQLFSQWRLAWQTYQGRDQFALARAMELLSWCHCTRLPERYNYPVQYRAQQGEPVPKDAVILHHWPTSAEGRLARDVA